MKKLVILSVAALMCVQAGAQKKWTLRECIDYAIENNIDIKQQELTVQDAEINLSTSKYSRLPDLSASVGYGISFGEMGIRRLVTDNTGAPVLNDNGEKQYQTIYEDGMAQNASFSASSSTTLFSGMRIHNQVKSNALNLKASMENLKKAKENLELSVTSYYLEVLFKKEILAVYEDQAVLTITQVERTAAMVESGKVPRSQLFDIKAQQARDELNVTVAANDLQFAVLNLAQLLNITDAYGFDITEPDMKDSAFRDSGSLLSPLEIYDMALSIKPHVKEAEYRLEGSKYVVKIEKSAYWPTLGLSLGYNNGFNHVFDSKNESISSQLKRRQNESIGLNLRIPIFNRLATRNRVRSAQLSVRNQELALDNVKLAIFKEIQQAHQGATAANAKMRSTEMAYEAALEAYTYAEESYGVGKATVYELSESQTKLFSARSQRLQAKYDYIFRSKILDFYCGKPIDMDY